MRLSIYILVVFVFSCTGCDSPMTGSEIKDTVKSTKQLPYFTYHREDVYSFLSFLRMVAGSLLKQGR